ncbi:MAG TPA: Spy/CpxP family protein refolding chaperone [Stellaceae bacterium]|nr:Spy/CpxP family protein refolding chaperone [Stellaceae bacterium]
MPIRIDRATCAIAAALFGASLLAAPIGVSAQQASPAQAQSAPVMPAPNAAKHHRGKRAQVDRIEARITSLHAELKLTPAQEPQWQAVAQVMRDNAHKIDAAVHARAEQRGTMSAVDNLSTYSAIVDAHATELHQLVPAFQALYATLSDAQKKNADAVFNQRPRGPRMAKKSG